jgi:hypothetical protein
MNPKPNCDTCPKNHTKDCPIDYEKSNGNSDIFDGMSRVRNNCIMACHPFARQWLVEDIVKELEMLKENKQLNMDFVTYSKIILIIRGVKK